MAGQDPALLRRLLRAKDRIDAASEEDWPVERLANVSGVSEAHFARSFKEAFGVPPHRYLLRTFDPYRKFEFGTPLAVGSSVGHCVPPAGWQMRHSPGSFFGITRLAAQFRWRGAVRSTSFQPRKNHFWRSQCVR
jgi:hypothetical protein